jgi:hypothetical protein
MTQEKIEIDPSNLPSSLSEASLFWFKLGYEVVPIVPKQKRPSVKLTDWLSSLSEDSVREHWGEYPDHEIAIHCGSSIMVLDADSPESEKALRRIEQKHSTLPWMRIRTAKGVHHYFRLAEGVRVQAAGYGSEAPEKIDIRHGQNSIALIAPSTDKVVESDFIRPPMALYDVNQEFVDAIVTHNGGVVKASGSKTKDSEASSSDAVDHESFTIPFDQGLVLDRVKDILTYLDPDLGYSDWIRILAAVFNSTQGSDDGLELVDSWSSRGNKYPGTREITNKWRSFRSDYEAQADFSTLLTEVQKVKPDWIERRSELEDSFTVEHWEIVPSSYRKIESYQSPDPISAQTSQALEEALSLPADHFLRKHSAVHHLEEMRRNTSPTVPLLCPIVVNGEFVVIYAAPNSGKTLLTLFLIRQGIIENRFSPDRIFHLNFDDSSDGARVKTELAQSYGFNAIVPGYGGASVESVKAWMKTMIETGSAKGVVFIFDTMKKFADPMQKSEISEFTSLCRQFTMKGGTVVALAHTNKRKDESGKPIPGGTSDVIDDCDCAWMLVSSDDGGGFRKAIFTRYKQRSSVPPTAAFRYDGGSNFDYLQRLDSVEYMGYHTEVDENFVKTSFTHTTLGSNRPTDIDVIRNIIKESFCTKGEILDEIRKRLGISRGKAESLLDRYTGDDPKKAHWNFRKGTHNASVYYLLEDEPLDR